MEEALAQYGTPEIFNTDQGCQFTSEDFTDVLKQARVLNAAFEVGAHLLLDRERQSVLGRSGVLEVTDTIETQPVDPIDKGEVVFCISVPSVRRGHDGASTSGRASAACFRVDVPGAAIKRACRSAYIFHLHGEWVHKSGHIPF